MLFWSLKNIKIVKITVIIFMNDSSVQNQYDFFFPANDSLSFKLFLFLKLKFLIVIFFVSRNFLNEIKIICRRDSDSWVSKSSISPIFQQTRNIQLCSTDEQFHIWFLTFACCLPSQCTISSHPSKTWERYGWRPPRISAKLSPTRLVVALE